MPKKNNFKVLWTTPEIALNDPEVNLYLDGMLKAMSLVHPFKMTQPKTTTTTKCFLSWSLTKAQESLELLWRQKFHIKHHCIVVKSADSELNSLGFINNLA